MKRKFSLFLLFIFLFSSVPLKCLAVEDEEGVIEYKKNIYDASVPWHLDKATRDAQENINNPAYLESKMNYYLNLAGNKTLDTNDLASAEIYAMALGKNNDSSFVQKFNNINNTIYKLKQEGKLNEERIALQSSTLPITSPTVNVAFTVYNTYKGVENDFDSLKYGAYSTTQENLPTTYIDTYKFDCVGSNKITFTEKYVYTKWHEKVGNTKAIYPADNIAGLTYNLDSGNLRIELKQIFSNVIKRKDKNENEVADVATEMKLLGYVIESFTVSSTINRYQGRGSTSAKVEYFDKNIENTKTTAIINSKGKLFYDYAGVGNLNVNVIFGVKYYLRVKTLYDMYIWEKKRDWVKKLDDLNKNGIKGEANAEVWNDKNKNGKKDAGEVAYKDEWHYEYEVVGGKYVFDDNNSKKAIKEISDYEDDFNNMYKTSLKRVLYTSNNVPVIVNGFYSVNYIGRNYRSTPLKMDALPKTSATLTYN